MSVHCVKRETHIVGRVRLMEVKTMVVERGRFKVQDGSAGARIKIYLWRSYYYY
jgi:hypothetical protein